MPNTESIGPFSQTLFLGASITRFSSKVGWNGDQGELTVELVEDPCAGSKIFYNSLLQPKITTSPDQFNPPKVGSPVYFRFGNFTYGGIMQNWEQQKDARGGVTYSVRCTDPTEVLEGSQVIINNYTGGVFGVPNLINAFGYNETLFSSCNTNAHTASLNPPLGYTPAQGFGGSNISQDGMSWYQIKDAIQAIVNAGGFSEYGNNLKLRDARYIIDISEVPTMDEGFRFQGDNLSILDMISEVCRNAGMDYFVELVYFPGGSIPEGYGGLAGHLHPDVIKGIKIKTVGRRTARTAAQNVDFTVGSPIDLRLNLGRISRFIGNGEGRARIVRGLELRNEVTNAMVVGDNRQDLWQQPYTGSADTYTDTIWPYWGKDALGFPIVSNGTGNDHNFTVSTLGWRADLIAAIGNTYTVTMGEMRAALDSMETWTNWMETFKQDIAMRISLDACFLFGAELALIGAANRRAKALDINDTRVQKAAWAREHAMDLEAEERKRVLFETVRSYAEMMGKKFLVSIPLLCSANDQDAPYSVKLNWQASDGAWTDNAVQISPVATALPQTSPVLELLRLEDGRLQAFVYFNSGGNIPIDYSQLSQDEVIPISEYECYVKATVEELTFLNPLTGAYPRAVVSISNPILLKFLEGEDVDAPIMQAFNANILGNIVGKLFNGVFGADATKLGFFPPPLLPLGAAVPLRSTNLSYGPWFSTFTFGPPAKTSYERNTGFSPWAFGSTDIMNMAAQATVETQVTQQVVNEAGSFTIPGAPSVSLGRELEAGGPDVTNIELSVDPQGGVQTTYRMRTWLPNFGEIGRRRVNALRNAGLFQFKLQRSFIKNSFSSNVGFKGVGNVGVGGNFIKELTRSDRFNRQSSHTIIAAENLQSHRTSTHSRPNIVITDMRKAMPELYDNYHSKAFMELGGLYAPFSTSGVAGQNMPAMSGFIPVPGTTITCLSLSPFKNFEQYYGTSQSHNVDVVSRGTTISGLVDFSINKGGIVSGTNVYRGVGLRGPVMIVGWGFDTNGKPVPNSNPASPTDSFATDYLRKPETWKAGPLDVRWDHERGVWSAAGGTTVKRGVLLSVLTKDSFASASGLVYNSTLNRDVGTEAVTVYDHILSPGQSISANTDIFYLEEGSRKYVISAACAVNA